MADVFSPEEREMLEKQLLFIQRAAAYVQRELAAEEKLPSWVIDRISQSTAAMKIVAGFIQKRREGK